MYLGFLDSFSFELSTIAKKELRHCFVKKCSRIAPRSLRLYHKAAKRSLIGHLEVIKNIYGK